jgi:hypothetical protein
MLARIRKAITAGLSAALAVLGSGATRPDGLGLQDVELAIGSAVVVGFLTWLIPNAQAGNGNPG